MFRGTLDNIFRAERLDRLFEKVAVKQHTGELLGKRKKAGRCSTGVVFEQELLVRRQDGTAMTVRRITIVRDKPTRRGEHEVHLLTNLPAKVKAAQAAEAYLGRWSIETAFQDLTTTLRCEINTRGYPKAAWFGFCLALLLFNIVSVVKAALRAGAQGTAEQKEKLSMSYLADEIAGVSRGMAIAIPAAHWEATFGTRTPQTTRGQAALAGAKSGPATIPDPSLDAEETTTETPQRKSWPPCLHL